mmetsp:Transcript_56951/g.180192  ORF Transcript_56951/g.180192 Transcript_56951/m.180192 type:complete len:311 (-) Transcript_56951:50-982(-)
MAQRLDLLERLGEGLAEALVLLRDLVHELLVGGLLLLHLRDVLLERLDEVEVVVRDVVVVVLDLRKRLLVLLHEIVDVRVLPLLDLVDLLLAPELEVVAEDLHLLLVLLLQLLGVELKLLPELGDLLGMLQLELPHHILVRQLLLLQLKVQAALVLVQVALVLPELVLRQLERLLPVGLEGRDVVLMLVQQMLDLLLVDLDLNLVPLLHLLHLAILVAELGLLVLKLLLRDLPEGIDFVTLELHVVAVLLLLVLLLLKGRDLGVELLGGRRLDIPAGGRPRRGLALLLVLPLGHGGAPGRPASDCPPYAL